MALTSPVISRPSCQILFFNSLPSRLRRKAEHVTICPTSASFPMKSPRMSMLSESWNFKVEVDHVRRKLHELTPDSVRKFPWKKAENAALERLLVLGKEVLKWSLCAMFILSCVSDTLYSIYRNKELWIPFGLFIGCITADFLREMSQELFPYSEEKGMQRHLLAIGSFVVLVKTIAVYLLDGPVFFMHAANGGLIQLLWHWKNSLQTEAYGESSPKDASIALTAE